MVRKEKRSGKSLDTLSTSRFSGNSGGSPEEELRQDGKDWKGASQSYLGFYHNVLREHEGLETDKSKQGALATVISPLNANHLDFTPEVNGDTSDLLKLRDRKDAILSEIALKAETLRRRKRNRAMILSAMKGGSAFMLVLALGLLQSNLPLYLFFALVACTVLGISTFLERAE